MKITLVRHAQSRANVENLVCGQMDFSLSERGEAQAQKLAQHLDDQNQTFTKIYTSALVRTHQTIAHLAPNQPRIVTPQLNELDTGSYSTMTLDALRAQEPRYRTPWLFPDLAFKDGETFGQMFDRIGGWFREAFATWDEQDSILIVGHEGSVRTCYCQLTNTPLDRYPDFSIGNCDQLVFTTAPGLGLGAPLESYQHVRFDTL